MRTTQDTATNKKVFVGLSGGVDSSVSAALLRDAGYEVTGVFIKVWDPPFLPCTWKRDRLDAMRVCAKLKIPFQTLDLSEEYKQNVVDQMIDSYKKGATPNPDILCNQKIKFGSFYSYAKRHGADYIATGHYARIQSTPHEAELLRSADSEKDQSYFLWTIPQEVLCRTLFPVGSYRKVQVRELAKRYDLPTAEKKDSQGLCFLGKLDMKQFLKRFIDERPGDVLDTDGNIIGLHHGTHLYTIGERHGFTITTNDADRSPLYVLTKDTAKNTIIVGPRDRLSTPRDDSTQLLTYVNWIDGSAPSSEKKLNAQIRYHGAEYAVTVEETSHHRARLTFLEEAPLVAEGQSIVIYDREICLGGGVA